MIQLKDVSILKRTKILKLLIQSLFFARRHNNVCSDIDALFNKRIDFVPTYLKVSRVCLLVNSAHLTTKFG